MGSAVTSMTRPLAIEKVKEEDVQNRPTSRSINIEGQKGVKEEGMALAAHTTDPAQSDCPAVDACCECGPTPGPAVKGATKGVLYGAYQEYLDCGPAESGEGRGVLLRNGGEDRYWESVPWSFCRRQVN